MKTEHIKIFLDLIDNNFKVTEVAKLNNKAQPVISTILKKMQQNWDVELFVRNGKQIKGLTPIGEQVAGQCRELMLQKSNLDKIIADGQNPDDDLVAIATTQTQARFTLNQCVKKFREKYPETGLKFVQGSPRQLTDYVLDGEVDFAFITEQSHLIDRSQLVEIPCYVWKRCFIAQRDYLARHNLQHNSKLERIAELPMISYEFSLDPFSSLRQYFASRQLNIDIAVAATDVEVIKTYVEMQLGIGIIASVAIDEQTDTNFVKFGETLLPPERVSLVVSRGRKLRARSQEFIFQYVPHLRYKDMLRLFAGEAIEREQVIVHKCPPLVRAL